MSEQLTEEEALALLALEALETKKEKVQEEVKEPVKEIAVELEVAPIVEEKRKPLLNKDKYEYVLKVITYITNKVFGEDNVDINDSYITVKFTDVLIKNSEGGAYLIPEIYTRIMYYIDASKLDRNEYYTLDEINVETYCRLNYSFEGMTIKADDAMLRRGYMHSHLPGTYSDISDYSRWDSFCLGSSEFGDILTKLSSDRHFNLDLYFYFLNLMYDFIAWESLEGVPHVYLNRMSDESSNYMPDLVSDYYYFDSEIVTDIIQEDLNRFLDENEGNLVKFNLGTKKFEPAISYLTYLYNTDSNYINILYDINSDYYFLKEDIDNYNREIEIKLEEARNNPTKQIEDSNDLEILDEFATSYVFKGENLVTTIYKASNGNSPTENLRPINYNSLSVPDSYSDLKNTLQTRINLLNRHKIDLNGEE